MVCFLYRPGYYNINEGPNGEAYPEGYTELIVAKHRNGALDEVKLTFLGQFAKFTNAVSGFGAEDYINAANGNVEPSLGMAPNDDFENETSTVTLGSKMNDDLPSDDDGVPF